MRRLVCTVIILTGVLFAACNHSNRTRIGVVPKAVAHVFWQSVRAGAVAAAREADVDIEWKGPAQETDFSRQIEIVDSMINAPSMESSSLPPKPRPWLGSSNERRARAFLDGF